MKRVSITLPDDLAAAVEAYLQDREVRPSLTSIIQAALRQYLVDRGYFRASGSLRITPARKGSTVSDVSTRHDRYLAAK
ncbi:MAG: CopG family ribbon-helix-helix protein [Candidatus Binataceae bacterium]